MRFSFAFLTTVVTLALQVSALPNPQGAPPADIKTDIIKSDAFGGDGGVPFDDSPNIPFGSIVKQLVVHAGEQVDQVQLELLDIVDNDLPFVSPENTHGGKGGQPKTLKLDNRAGEIINALTVRVSGNAVVGLTVGTSLGQTFTAGSSGGVSNVIPPPGSDFGLIGFHGSAGNRIDKLGAIWGKNVGFTTGA